MSDPIKVIYGTASESETFIWPTVEQVDGLLIELLDCERDDSLAKLIDELLDVRLVVMQ